MKPHFELGLAGFVAVSIEAPPKTELVLASQVNKSVEIHAFLGFCRPFIGVLEILDHQHYCHNRDSGRSERMIMADSSFVQAHTHDPHWHLVGFVSILFTLYGSLHMDHQNQPGFWCNFGGMSVGYRNWVAHRVPSLTLKQAVRIANLVCRALAGGRHIRMSNSHASAD